MSRSFLASLRGADARSVARALALLLVFNAIFGAFHAGAMANGAESAILCTSGGAVVSEGLPQVPTEADEISCCVLGSGPSSTAIAAESAALTIPAFEGALSSRPHFETVLRELKYTGSASPRGPPALA